MTSTAELQNQQMDRILFGDHEKTDQQERRIENMLTFECGDMGKQTLGEVVLMSAMLKEDMQTKAADMLDLVFDAREKLKDSEYKNLSEGCGLLRMEPEAQVILIEMVAERLKISVAKCRVQQIMMRDMKQQIKTYRENLFRVRREWEEYRKAEIHTLNAVIQNLNENPSIICSCGKTYKSKSGLKRHRKKTKCPTSH